LEEIRDDILINGQLAACQNISNSMLNHLMLKGKIFSQKTDRHWRFLKGVIDYWLEETRAYKLGS